MPRTTKFMKVGNLKCLTGLKSKSWQGRFFLEALGETPFPGLFQPLEVPTFLVSRPFLYLQRELCLPDHCWESSLWLRMRVIRLAPRG